MAAPEKKTAVKVAKSTASVSLHDRLVNIQQTLDAPKDQHNAFSDFMYRSAEGILEAVKPLTEGLTLTLSDKMIAVGDRVYVEATATLSDGKETIAVTASAREADQKKGMDSGQLTGSTSSYARKYALNGLLLIDDAKDPDRYELTDTDRGWIDAIKAGTDNLSNIEDQQYRDFIQRECEK